MCINVDATILTKVLSTIAVRSRGSHAYVQAAVLMNFLYLMLIFSKYKTTLKNEV